jgi:hypothetical protein
LLFHNLIFFFNETQRNGCANEAMFDDNLKQSVSYEKNYHLPMRLLLIICYCFTCMIAFSQRGILNKHLRVQYSLVAQNNKHKHWYYDNNPLKIYYKDSAGNIIKATGRLFVNDSLNIELDRRNGKIISIINPANITRIQRWTKPAWKAVGALSAAGLLLGIPVYINRNNNNPNPGLLPNIVFGLIDVYFIAADIPVILISSALSIKRQSKGYHFYIARD